MGTVKSRVFPKVLAFFFAAHPLFAQTAFTSADPDVSLGHLPDKALHDLSNLFTPDNAFVGITGGFLTFGDWIVLDHDNPWPPGLKSLNTPGLWDFGNFYGEGWVEGFGGVGCWAAGGIASDDRLAQFGRDASESLIMATLLATGLKEAVRRERPDKSNDLSFPSGHAITAFCVAPVIARYGGAELGIPAYALAALTALSRVEGEHHYLSDVLGGATLGILVGDMVLDDKKDPALSIAPGEMTLTFRFN